jgi:membrane-bound lytic murein transglycosylase MltF
MAGIAEVESGWDPRAVHLNANGTWDRGLMQLNSSWYNDADWADPEANLAASAKHIAMLRSKGLSWWHTAIAYNCGIGRAYNPPPSSVQYAADVLAAWERIDPYFHVNVRR